MNSDQLPLDDVTQIYCDFGLHGWSNLIFVRNGEPLVFRVSHVFTDFAETLISICNAVIQNTSLRVALYDEPGGVIFDLQPDRDKQHTTIVTLFEADGPYGDVPEKRLGKRIFSTRLRRQRLIGMLVSELWKTHVFLKQPSYQEARSVFPHRELQDLNKRWHQSTLGPSFLI